MSNIIGLKELRENMDKYAKKIQNGESFLVMKRSKALFKLMPIDDTWEEVVDFTKIKKGGVHIDDILSRL